MGLHQVVLAVVLMYAGFMFLIAEHVVPDPVMFTFAGIQLTFSQLIAIYSLTVAYFAFRKG